MKIDKLIFNALLPYPVTVNKYWRKGKTSNGKTIIHLSSEAKRFTQTVVLLVAQNTDGRCSAKRLKGEFVLHPKDRRKQDIDNRLKSLLDAMQKARLYIDDEQFDEIIIRRGEMVKGGCVSVKIWEVNDDVSKS